MRGRRRAGDDGCGVHLIKRWAIRPASRDQETSISDSCSGFPDMRSVTDARPLARFSATRRRRSAVEPPLDVIRSRRCLARGELGAQHIEPTGPESAGRTWTLADYLVWVSSLAWMDADQARQG